MSDPTQPWPVVEHGSQGHPALTVPSLLHAHGQDIAGVFGPAVTWRALVSGMLSF